MSVKFLYKFDFADKPKVRIVRSQWRGRGYGLQLWQTAWQHLVSQLDSKQPSIGLDGVVERESTYRQAGFTAAYRHVRHVCEPMPCHQVPDDVISLTNVPLEQIVRYDAELFPAPRPQFLEPWIRVATAAYGISWNTSAWLAMECYAPAVKASKLDLCLQIRSTLQTVCFAL